MNTKVLKVDRRDKPFHQFGSTSNFSLESNFGDGVPRTIELPNEVDCTAISAIKVAYSKDKQNYDVNDLWSFTPHSATGADPRDTLGTAVKRGLLNLSTKIYDKLFIGYYRADVGIQDPFDNIRSAMTINNSSCTLASYWYDNWNNVNQVNGIMPQGGNIVSEHDYVFLDWKLLNGVNYALIDAHLGYDMLMPREVLNMEISRPGCGAWMPSDKVGTTTQIRNLLEWLVDLYQNLLLSLKRVQIPSPVIQAKPSIVESKSNISITYAWDTPIIAKHSVRIICDEEGLDLEQKNTMCATIGGESGWDIHAKRLNYAFKKDGTRYLASTDWGICQWNDFWHAKEITPDESVNNPEKAVRLMCAYWKRGQRDTWIAYKNGSYKNYL